MTLDLAKIEARVNAATKGEWYAIHTVYDWFVGIPRGKGHIAISRVYRGAQGGQDQAEANAVFISHAHQDIPALTARVAELEAALKPFAIIGAETKNHGLSDLWCINVPIPDLRRAAEVLK